MSRTSLISLDGRFQVYFGVDDITSTFVQVYDNSTGFEHDKDEADFVVDNQGVRQSETPVPELKDIVVQFNARFALSRQRNNPYPNLGVSDVMLIFNALKMGVDDQVVYRLLD